MKVVQITFSPTGGTQKAADLLSQGVGTLVQTISLADRSASPIRMKQDGQTVAVIAVPSYGGRMPELAAYRLKDVQGNGMPCVLLCVYGNRAFEDTLVEMEDVAREAGFEPVAAVAAVAEHSILRQFATGRPDASDAADLAAMGKRIAQKLEESWKGGALPIPGNRPYKKRSPLGLVPKAESGCLGCGVCAKDCPAGAISSNTVRSPQANKALCISCMRCVTNCPAKVRKVNGAMLAMSAAALKKACSVRKNCELWL